VKLLAVADTRDRALYEHFRAERWAKEGIELIVSCGDLPADYLDFLVSVFNVPCFYVRGNHDTAYGKTPTGGAVNLHEHLEKYKGVKLFGLEGSPWYNGGPAQYTEGQMRWPVSASIRLTARRRRTSARRATPTRRAPAGTWPTRRTGASTPCAGWC
jgi:hypothetical protein